MLLSLDSGVNKAIRAGEDEVNKVPLEAYNFPSSISNNS